MKFIHTVEIEQLPDGNTRLMQESRKDGEGQMSPRMRQAMADYFDAFGEFLSRYTDKPVGLISAEPGRLTVRE
jgi:hypothetical protein